jgi:DNA invertase Pin-like site-specific DNA recombinase
MMEDAKAGKIQCIVCKDASRLGRNYLETGEYMERIFPLLGIRLVCISEGYDSGRDIPGGLGINIRNLMYQWYAQDIGRKVRMVKEEKKQRGEYLGSRAPYGFCICLREGKRVLGPDIPARKIAEEIFLWHREGLKPRQIQEKLKRQGVNPPGIYQKTGCIYGKKGEVKCWNPSTIRHVISWYRKER